MTIEDFVKRGQAAQQAADQNIKDSTAMTPAHTPQTWTIDPKAVDSIRDSNGRIVCEVFGDDGEFDDRVRLIAQAPAMREALKETLAVWQQVSELPWDSPRDIAAELVRVQDKARAILAELEKP